jgi:predicted dehydrogenase
MRLGIVGCGLIGQKRADAARRHHVVAVADTDRARAEALAARTGATASTDWRTVIDAAPDFVIVAVSHDHLAEIALAAVTAGRHVLIEKPGARTAAELMPVAVAARRTGARVKIGFNHRFHPAFLKARELIDEGVAGDLMYIRGRYGHGGRIGYEREWRMRQAISGGGELIDQGAHLIDLARWFLGDFTHVDGWTPTYYWPVEVDDNCFMALRTGRGQMAWLHATWTEWKNTFSFEISGRDAKLQIDGLGGSYGTERLTLYRMLPELGPPETTIWEFPFPDRSWEREIDEFVQAIQQDRAPIGDIDDGLAMLGIVDRIYGTAATSKGTGA